MNRIVNAVLVVLLLAVGWAMAQYNAMSAKPNEAKPAAKVGSMPMPKPAPQMTKLINMMWGYWTVSEKADPNPMMPKGGTGQGMARMLPGPGGMSLLETYRSSGLMNMNFRGSGTLWWDSKAQAYRVVWCDNTLPGGCDASGTSKWEGDKLVSTMESEMHGQKTVTRFTYSDWKPDSFVMTMEIGADARSLKPAMTVTYTRTTPPSTAAVKPAAQ